MPWVQSLHQNKSSIPPPHHLPSRSRAQRYRTEVTTVVVPVGVVSTLGVPYLTEASVLVSLHPAWLLILQLQAH